MKQKFKEIALQAGGSHYPDVGGDLLEKFGEMVVQECIDIIEGGDYRSSTFTTYDQYNNPRIIHQCVENIKKSFKE
jgi:hypothetical protein